MDVFLIAVAIILFVFGALLLFNPGAVKKISDWLNKNVILIEDIMFSSNLASGTLLVLLGAVVLYLAMRR